MRVNGACYVGRLDLSNDYVLPSLFTYNNSGRIYNADMLHSLPAIVIEKLVGSKPGEIELLPALSDKLPTGEITGVRCRCRTTIDRLSWNLPQQSIKITLHSTTAQTLTLRLRRGIDSVVTAEGENLELASPTCGRVDLEPQKPLGLAITLSDD